MTQMTIEDLLGLESGNGRTMHRVWWRVARDGATRFLIPMHRPGIKTALGMVSSRRNYWGLRAMLWISRFTRQPEAVGTRLLRSPLDDLMTSVFPDVELHYAVYYGTASLYQKYTVQAQDLKGRARAYIKISQGPRARESLVREASVLRQLGDHPILRGSVPVVLKVTEQWGCCVSVLSGAGDPSSRAPSFPSDVIVGFLAELFSVDRVSLPWAHSPVRARIVVAADRLARAGEQAAVKLLHDAVSILDRVFERALLPHGRAHGDFLPWNVRLSPNPYVFDWEWSRLALPFHDLYHYLVFPNLQDCLSGSVYDLSTLWRSPEVLRLGEGISCRDVPFAINDIRLLQVYAADTFAFYAESACANGETLPGSPLIRKLTALLQLALAGR
jgi:hypothetical protein